jgi:hypothetical protein
MKIIVDRSDGGVTVMMRPGEISPELAEQHVVKWQSTFSEAQVVSYAIVGDDYQLPPFDEEYRNAWTLRAGRIDHDMPRAREIHRARIRERRKPLLEEQDLAWTLVEEDETLTAAQRLMRRRAITARRRQLRDAPADPRIEAAQTIEELRAVDPLAEAP